MKRIVAIVGDYYHDESLARESLVKAFEAIPPDEERALEFVGTKDMVRVLEERPDAVVLFKENRLNPQDEKVELWMDEAVSSAIASYVREGGAWLAWHAGLASYPEEYEYVKMLRGFFLSHPAQNKPVRYVPVHTEAAGRSGEALGFVDEHYFVSCDENDTEVFLRSESEDGSSIAGWRHAYGKGKVLCLTPAHRREGLLDPSFLKLLGGCLEWCATR
ncbi:ThuA domain-containing protein [Cohnella zeiphila]|uniref:ThuA domain-containing protein n=1 Tax=Cohnella zeiphila TaxID=2761120 RepID=A0A7X0SUM3_9BACL|nr:ThuA domain-containing protein [Cohnella zeiphila]MBB6734178.1 ThuA domain-containing protein [Cohnella zeiphila]